MTRAEVLAEYLGLAPETHPWCFERLRRCCRCGEDIGDCNCCYEYVGEDILALPNPLAPGHEADVWLGVLQAHDAFMSLSRHPFAPHLRTAKVMQHGHTTYAVEEYPTPAIVRAMMAADPEFAAKMEGAMG